MSSEVVGKSKLIDHFWSDATDPVLAAPVMSAEQRSSPSATRVLFGPFDLNVTERSLKKADEIIPLGARAFDILIALIDKAGEIVSKGELIEKVWPDVTVEEGSLRVHLSALRKALGDGQFGHKYITNVHGRGYCFVSPVRRQAAEDRRDNSFARSSNLPPALGRMIGRDDAVLEIQSGLKTERLVTILGTGGIGKTTVALAVGHAALADFSGAVFFVDISALGDEQQIVGALAAAIGLRAQRVDGEDVLLNYLRSRRVLLVLDSCEHLIEEVSDLIDRVLHGAPGVCILATSQEALQLSGERVFCLPPLDCPPEQPGQTAAQVLSYPSARLFVDRITARWSRFSLSDDEAPLVVEICRKLDGIPLAIELAAGRAAIFGVKDTAARLGSRLDLLKFGRRTATPRHQTLRATLDWSYDHLSEIERVVLRRVSILTGHFTLEASLAVAEEEGIWQPDVTEAMGRLVNKSLIGSRMESRGISYRLLDTTRTYAFEKLISSGEHDKIAARHANFVVALLEANSVNLFDLGASKGVASSIREYLGDVRSALEWSFGVRGSDGIAMRLAAAAAQLFLSMSLLLECRNWMLRAIDRMREDCEPRHQMEIYASLALSLMFAEGNSEKVRDAFNTALIIAERHGDAYRQLRLLSGLSMYFNRLVDVAGSLEVALRGEAVAKKTGNPDDAAIADSMLGQAYYLLGEHHRAQKHLERALYGSAPLRRVNASQYLFDLRSRGLFVLARSHWCTGKLDRAVRYAAMAVEEAEHPIALCRALVMTMPIYFWIDDLDQIEKTLSNLEITAETHSLEPYRAIALGLRGRYLIRLSRVPEGIQLLRGSLEELKNRRYEMPVADFASELAVSLAKQNARAEALALVNESIAGQMKSNRVLQVPKLFLAKGLAFAYGDAPEVRSAEGCLEKAMDLARRQSALAFELRAGLELARIWIGRDEVQRAYDLVAPIYSRFSEGFRTPDLVMARELLGQTGRG
jgi:predicted ATPase/DNA-binding winged helix-turn-helix (wHTH) protein